MHDELRVQSTEAIRAAAERLGVDPIRLARFLSDGRLADALLQLRAAGISDGEAVELAESYLSFLEQEMRVAARAPGNRLEA